METSRLNEVKPSQGTRRSRVQVRAVHVDLAAALVRDAREVRDRLLEDAVGRGVGHHDGRQVVLVFFGLRFKIVEVDVAGVVGLDLRVDSVRRVPERLLWPSTPSARRCHRVDGATAA